MSTKIKLENGIEELVEIGELTTIKGPGKYDHEKTELVYLIKIDWEYITYSCDRKYICTAALYLFKDYKSIIKL
ncbi:MAG: hypothetical protein PHF86_12720 [Candidatus Nanoarchaeia archaeon]|nr:hypothetical protein [Candidatus Nanoarchaeia archaeon]